MADRTDYYFRQVVTEAALDLGFELLEKADRNLAADIGVWGIVGGAEPAPHSPLPDLTIDLAAPARAYDHLGQRIFFGTGQTVDCAVDSTGIPTTVSAAGNERWLGIFLRFERLLSDPRTDGNSQQVYFRRDESFAIGVRQAPEGPVGTAPRVPLEPDELLICDVRRSAGQTQILSVDIDTSRRQAFVFARGDAVEVVSGLWSILEPAANTVQATLDEVDAELASHFDGSGRRHTAAAIESAPHGFISATTVQGAIEEVVGDLASGTTGSPGAALVGADEVPGTPNALAAGTVDGQLAQLLAELNEHEDAVVGAHAASAIAATPHSYIAATNVQAQLQELVADLRSQGAGQGASQIGNDALPGGTIPQGTVREQLTDIATLLGTHDHDGRYYNYGEQVGDADTLDGLDATDLSLVGHDHDDRYVRRIYFDGAAYDVGQARQIADLDEIPDIVQFFYAYVNSNNIPTPSIAYVNGLHTTDIRVSVEAIDLGGGDKQWRVQCTNDASVRLYIWVRIFGRDIP